MFFPDLNASLWQQVEGNPIVDRLRDKDAAGDAYGDPQVLLPGCYDDQWHMFFHGFVVEDGRWDQYFHHMVSMDGIHWTLKKQWASDMGQSFVFKEGDTFYFYSSCYEQNGGGKKLVSIKVYTTKNFEDFSGPYDLLFPEYDWELEGKYDQVRNPCVIRLPDGRYRMYYCGGVVILPDLGYEEPKYVSYAESDSPMGPFVKCGHPILSPAPELPHRSLGSGAIKVFGYGDEFIALYNGIHTDGQDRSSSSISVLRSADGITWEEAPYNPIIRPDSGWRTALVYQLDLVSWNGELRIYYNARDEWRDGIEKIGMSWMPYSGTPIRRLNGLDG